MSIHFKSTISLLLLVTFIAVTDANVTPLFWSKNKSSSSSPTIFSRRRSADVSSSFHNPTTLSSISSSSPSSYSKQLLWNLRAGANVNDKDDDKDENDGERYSRQFYTLGAQVSPC
mmetsp:Transcript_6089/g.9072  ORF Transcript_6089/g.9072 Transcript_6089/m.9072 type:complete len:116 (-) Transcript_6089:863-1210(-)